MKGSSKKNQGFPKIRLQDFFQFFFANHFSSDHTESCFFWVPPSQKMQNRRGKKKDISPLLVRVVLVGLGVSVVVVVSLWLVVVVQARKLDPVILTDENCPQVVFPLLFFSFLLLFVFSLLSPSFFFLPYPKKDHAPIRRLPNNHPFPLFLSFPLLFSPLRKRNQRKIEKEKRQRPFLFWKT